MYKYKSANDNDMRALEKNELWVSTLKFMNDPTDLGFYINRSKHTDEEIIKFQEVLNNAFVIISLSKTVQNRRLWNYYTDGMKGYVLKYNNDDLKKALRNLGATKIISGSVEYNNEKNDLTDLLDTYLATGEIPPPKEMVTLFKKDDSWQSEDEYRIIADSGFLSKYPGATEKGGICLENIIPTQIVIGYRMEEDKQKKIIEYARKNDIEVRKFIPDFRSKSSKVYKSINVYDKKTKNESHDEEESEKSHIPDGDEMVIHENTDN